MNYQRRKLIECVKSASSYIKMKFINGFFSFVSLFMCAQGVAFLLALVVFAGAEEEEKKAADTVAVEDSNAEESKADALTDKKQEKRGIHEYGDWHGGHHEEKTVTIVKKNYVPVPHVKTVHVPHVKEVHVPVKIGVPKPYPVVKHVRT